MFNAVNILEALKNYIRTRGGQSAANNIAEAVNDLNSIPQGSGGGIPEAPIDDNQYARKNGDWSKVESSGGDIPDEVTNAIETGGMGWTEEEEVSAINIEWDGNAEGLERDASGLYAKISDLDIPNDQIVGLKFDTSYVSTHEFEKTIEITQEKFESLVSAGVITEDFSFLDSFVIIHKDGAVLEDIEFPHKGIYDYAAEDAATYTSRIYKEATTEEVVHQIDQKYIPQSSGGAMIVHFSIEVDGDVAVLSADKTPAEVITGALTGPVMGTIIAPSMDIFEISPIGSVEFEDPGFPAFWPQKISDNGYMIYWISTDENNNWVINAL